MGNENVEIFNLFSTVSGDGEISETTVSSIEEVYEESLVEGTDNIIMKAKKYILPIENLNNADYVQENH